MSTISPIVGTWNTKPIVTLISNLPNQEENHIVKN